MPCSYLKKILLLLLIVFAFTAKSQVNNTSKSSNMWQLNYNLGFTQFYGDVSSSGYFDKLSGQIGFATGATARWYFNPVVGIGGNFLYGNLKSNKDQLSSGDDCNYTLTGKYFDANLHLVVDFSNLFWGIKDRKLSIYGTLGMGYATWQSELYDGITGTITVSGDDIGDYTYKNMGFEMPVSMGINYMLNNSWSLNMDISLRTVFIDDVDVWRDGFKYDQLVYTGFGISYFINSSAQKSVKKTKSKKSTYSETSKKTITDPQIIDQTPIDPNATIPFYDFDYSQVKKRNTEVKKSTPEISTYNAPVVSYNDKLVFRVQILAISKRADINYIRSKYNISGDIHENYSGGIYRYSVGSFSSYNQAVNYSKNLKYNGISDAFVVAYENNKKVNITSGMKKN